MDKTLLSCGLAFAGALVIASVVPSPWHYLLAGLWGFTCGLLRVSLFQDE